MKPLLKLLLKMRNSLFLQSKQDLYYAKWKTRDISMYFSKVFYVYFYSVEI